MKSELVYYIIIAINVGVETTDACFKKYLQKERGAMLISEMKIT